MKNIYLIGNTNECKKYLENNNNVNLLPLNSLPVVYFPFQYNKKNSNNDNMKYFSKIIEKNNLILDNTGRDEYDCDNESENSVKCSNLTQLYNSISNMETEWQPYNNNNINLILVIIIIIWILILFIILKILHFYLGTYYSNFILYSTGMLLIFSIFYSLYVTAKNF